MGVPTQEILLPETAKARIRLHIRREDLLHPVISGNKYRKLKYNLEQARNQGHHTLLTFGGAYSNHIAATARAGKERGFRTIGIIRGEEAAIRERLNPTLSQAAADGMLLRFVDRQKYRLKGKQSFLQLLDEAYGPFYLLPEGGTNMLAIKGCEEILNPSDYEYEVLCCSVGTGGTLAGIINSSGNNQSVIGFPALKGEYLIKDICSFVTKNNWHLESGYHFGGYGKIDDALVTFINSFRRITGVPLDPVYTGKLMYGVLDLIRKGNFAAGTKILAIHTGGLQGIAGMNQRLKTKNKPLLEE